MNPNETDGEFDKSREIKHIQQKIYENRYYED